MVRWRSARAGIAWVAILGVVCAAIGFGLQLSVHRRAEDRNHNGRPDVWRVFDVTGALAEAAIDTDFDGDPDVHEFYVRGTLIRRQIDRDHDRRIDLFEEFDSRTGEHVSSESDVDRDGTVDLVVVFNHDRPVATWTRSPDGLTSLDSPAGVAPAIRLARDVQSTQISPGLSSAGGLPRDAIRTTRPSTLPTSLYAHAAAPLVRRSHRAESPRGPPAVAS